MIFLSVALSDWTIPLGFIQEDYLRELLTTMGDRFTDEEVDELFREAPIDKKSNFNYVEFTRILKHGAKDKDDWKASPAYSSRSARSPCCISSPPV